MSTPTYSSRSVKIANWLYQAIPVLVLGILLNLFFAIIGPWVQLPWSAPSFVKYFYAEVAGHIVSATVMSVLLSIILFLVWLLAKTMKDVPVTLSGKEIMNLYIKMIIEETREAEIKGLFPGMTAQYLPPAQLRQIFYLVI